MEKIHMGNGFEIHKSQRNFEQAVARLDKDSEVSAENRRLILSFAKMRLARGSSRLRVVKCVYCMRFLAKWFKKPFDKATKNELIELVGEIENKDYAENTKYDFKIVLKMFYKWLKGNDETFPPEIAWLKPKLNNHAHKLPEELITEREVFSMAEAADHPRDKALILALYETGCRIGEMLSLRMKNVIFDQYGAILRVTGKTGDRRVRIISSAPTLASWISIYADAKNPEAPLWPPISNAQRHKGEPAEYRSIYVRIAEIAKKAGVNKRVYPHLFRHSRATSLAGKLTEAQMKEYFGWVQSSEMASVYVHLSGRDVDNALLALQGMVKPEDKKEELLRICACPRCKEQNSPIAKFCLRCGTPMDVTITAQIEEERKSGDNLMNQLMKDGEFRELLLRKATELGFDRPVV